MTAGSRLAITPGAWGCWSYLVFAGALEARRWLGSRATHAPSGLGGGIVTSGARLVVDADRGQAQPGDAAWPAVHPRPDRYRLVLGPQDQVFTPWAREALLTAPFTVSRRFDRMGITLEGPRLEIAGPLDMPSEPIMRRAIQVPGQCDPVVLMADHQPTGGYPKNPTLIGADQDSFAQLRPGDIVQFRAVGADEAVAAARESR
jgi:allophanate hydrolase